MLIREFSVIPSKEPRHQGSAAKKQLSASKAKSCFSDHMLALLSDTSSAPVYALGHLLLKEKALR